jgi:hypothetical protein
MEDEPLWKTLHVKNRRKCDQCEGCHEGTFWVRNWACGHLDAAWQLRSWSHCHLCDQSFDQQGYSSGSAAPMLTWSKSVWLLPFPETQIPLWRLELWTTSKRLWQTSWGHFHMKTSSTATGSGNNFSDGVWLPKGTTLKGAMLIFCSVVNKKFYSTSRITF